MIYIEYMYNMILYIYIMIYTCITVYHRGLALLAHLLSAAHAGNVTHEEATLPAPRTLDSLLTAAKKIRDIKNAGRA